MTALGDPATRQKIAATIGHLKDGLLAYDAVAESAKDPALTTAIAFITAAMVEHIARLEDLLGVHA
jgi:hypothetical protein